MLRIKGTLQKYILSSAEYSDVTEGYKDFNLEAWLHYYIQEEGVEAINGAAEVFKKRVGK